MIRCTRERDRPNGAPDSVFTGKTDLFGASLDDGFNEGRLIVRGAFSQYLKMTLNKTQTRNWYVAYRSFSPSEFEAGMKVFVNSGSGGRP
jgi:hypothetical protein